MIFFSKLASEVRNFTVSLTDRLSASEQILSIAGLVVSPTDVSLTVVPTISIDGKGVVLAITGGTTNFSYQINFTATTSLAQVIAVSVGLSVTSTTEYPVDSAESIPRLSGQLTAGDTVFANSLFTYPAGTSLVGGILVWQLLDTNGILHASGFGEYSLSTAIDGSTLINGQAVVTTPSDLQPSDGTLSYQLRWQFSHPSLTQPAYSYETLTVVSNYEVKLGIEDAIELAGTTAVISCILDAAYDYVSMEVYDRYDTVVLTLDMKATETQVSGGVAYTAQVATTNFAVDLVPRTLAAKYSNSTSSTIVNRVFGRLYVVTPSTLAACQDLRMFINKTNTTVVGQPDMVFTQSQLLTFLRMGRDYFNMIFQLTNFTMARASGGIRDGWLMCTSIRALRSHFMSEGEQAFDYQGQAISLNVDRTQYYDSLASNLEGQLEMFNRFKTQLTKRGITDGDGDLDNTSGRFGNIAAVGLNATPISGFSMGYRRRLPMW